MDVDFFLLGFLIFGGLWVIVLGGINEIGCNMMVFEYLG